MNLQEREQLNHFLKQLGEAKLSAKDTEAEALIREATASQPDTAYLLVQRTLLLEQALNSAKAQINDLQNQLQNSPPAAKNGFLNNDPWAQPPTNPGQVPGAGNYQMPRYANPAPAPVQAPAFGGGASSFLGNVATTAAGVVAGSFLAQGIGSLLGHHQSSPWDQPHHATDNDEATADHTTINNFYGSDAEPQAFHEASYNDSDFVSDDADDFQDGGDSDWI